MLLKDKYFPPDLCEQSSCCEPANTTANHYRIEATWNSINRETLLQNLISLLGIRHQLGTKTLPEGTKRQK